MRNVAKPILVASLLLFALSAVAQPIKVPKIPKTSKERAELHHFGKEINTPHIEYTPFITPDEKFLYFESDRPGGVGETGDFDLWFAENRNKMGQKPDFKFPVNMGRPVNTDFFDGLPSLRQMSDGTYELYFTSFNSTDNDSAHKRLGPKSTNIYYSRLIQGKWTDPKPVIELNTDFHDRMPSISPDGNHIYFSSDRPGGFGKDDIWVSSYDFSNNRWQKPRNLGKELNTSASEISPSIHSDNITLYFSSDRASGVGGFDIYVTQRNMTQGSLFKAPQNMGTPYNSPNDDEYPTVSQDGSFMYFTSNREGGYGLFDIYRARVPEFAKPEVVITMSGYVHDASTLKGLEANIEVRGNEGIRNFSTALASGKYSIDFINKRLYKLVITSPGYQPLEYTLDLRDKHTKQRINKQFGLMPAFRYPKKFVVRTRFKNEIGETISPNVTYVLAPSSQERILTKKLKDDSYELWLRLPIEFKDAAKLRAHLKKSTYTLNAQLKGYKPKSTTFDLSEIINLSPPLSEKHQSPDIILQKEATTVVQKIDTDKPIKTDKDKTTDIITDKKITGKKQLAGALYYRKDRSALTRGNRAILRGIVKRFKAGNYSMLRVDGHADSDGGFKYNVRLSRKRALEVKRALIALGIAKDKVQPNWFSYSRPRAKGKSELAKRKNRRVEIYYISKPKKKTTDNTKNDGSKEKANQP